MMNDAREAFRHDVKRRMLRLISDDASDSCPNVIWRLYEMVKIAGATSDPALNLQYCGIIFEGNSFRVDRSSLSTTLLVPEAVLARRLDECRLTLIPQEAKHRLPKEFDDPCRPWETRTYAKTPDCIKLVELVSLVYGSTDPRVRQTRGREPFGGSTCECTPGRFVPISWPLSLGHGPPNIRMPPADPNVQKYLNWDGRKAVTCTLVMHAEPTLPVPSTESRDPIWKGI
jgi:hypothetical protein